MNADEKRAVFEDAVIATVAEVLGVYGPIETRERRQRAHDTMQMAVTTSILNCVREHGALGNGVLNGLLFDAHEAVDDAYYTARRARREREGPQRCSGPGALNAGAPRKEIATSTATSVAPATDTRALLRGCMFAVLFSFPIWCALAALVALGGAGW